MDICQTMGRPPDFTLKYGELLEEAQEEDESVTYQQCRVVHSAWAARQIEEIEAGNAVEVWYHGPGQWAGDEGGERIRYGDRGDVVAGWSERKARGTVDVRFLHVDFPVTPARVERRTLLTRPAR